jgi:drug/metabolite transporter (DMT)-like permease
MGAPAWRPLGPLARLCSRRWRCAVSPRTRSSAARRCAGEAIDAWSFTAVRLASGALVLGLLARTWREGSWASALALVAYAGLFSLAYLLIPAGVGALVLFGAVQATMIGWSVRAGRRPAAAGVVRPGTRARRARVPDAAGRGRERCARAGLMACAGIAWGVYSLRGRSGGRPLLATAGNFARGVVLVLPFAAFAKVELSTRGLVLACASGALASGLGYSLWYAALPGMSATRAALVQLSVPL